MNILITGGSSGLGKATVEILARDNVHVIYFTYNRHSEAAFEIVQKLNNVHALECDFTNDAHLDRLAEKMDEIDLDVLINNAYAGKPETTHFHKIAPDDFTRGFMENILPTIKITQKAISVFRKKKAGKIINVLTSYLLNLPPSGLSLYAANKAYIQQLSKSWNKEYAAFNITSNCIAPEYMETGFSDTDERLVEQMRAAHPLKKLLCPEEAAKVLRFLVNAPPHLNGATIPIV
jgi:NAD(P)-dependent dehydrogenase (short-subunit alcohol dehydrogenase family)